MFRAVDPLVTAKNQVLPLRRAKAATSRSSETGRTTVSSQTLGIFFSTSTEGFASILTGCAEYTSRGDWRMTALATWCAHVVSARREPKCTGCLLYTSPSPRDGL